MNKINQKTKQEEAVESGRLTGQCDALYAVLNKLREDAEKYILDALFHRGISKINLMEFPTVNAPAIAGDATMDYIEIHFNKVTVGFSDENENDWLPVMLLSADQIKDVIETLNDLLDEFDGGGYTVLKDGSVESK